jgi:hypothetical protein
LTHKRKGNTPIPALFGDEGRRDREAQYKLADYAARRDREGLAPGEAAIWQRYVRACAAATAHGLTVAGLRDLLAAREAAVADLEAILPLPVPTVAKARA